MDEIKRIRLIVRMGEVEHYNGGFAPKRLPLVSLEDYFDGSGGESGMLANTDAAPEDSEILQVLRRIRDRADVGDVRILIMQCGEGEWPFSDTIAIATTATADAVRAWWPEGYEPSEIFEDSDVTHLTTESMPLRPGERTLWVWYD